MNIILIGAGGHGRVVLDILREAGEHTPVGFIDADTTRAGATVDGLPVLGPVNLLPRLRKQDVRGAIVAIGDNRVRRTYSDMVVQNGLELVCAVHPRAIVSPAARLGKNVVIAPGAIVGAAAEIGDDVIVNTGAIVDHECIIGRAVHICPGVILAGRVEIGPGAFIGIGAKVLPCLKVGANATVGAGAVILEDVPADCTVVGVPARIIRAATEA